MKTKVKVVFPASKPDSPSWPYINYDVPNRAREVMSVLREQLDGFDLSHSVYDSPEAAETAFQAEKGQFDGYLVYMTYQSGVTRFYARHARPLIVADELYSGSGEFLGLQSLVKQEHLPVLSIASSDLQDVIDAVRLIGVMKQMRESRTLVVADGDTWGGGRPAVASTRELFGTEVLRIGSDELAAYYERVNGAEAQQWKDKWVQEALSVVEPDEAEILRSARMYLALKAAMHDKEADAVTVDCLGLYYGGKLIAYPCLAFFQLNNEGSTGVCEADVDSTLTQLLIRYSTGRPGYVSDPVIDTATRQIIYAHCVATNRAFGPQGLANPYIIRSHSEDRKGASVQSLLPLGYPVTSIKMSVRNKAFSVHTGRAVANIEEDRACRTKLAAEVDAARILDNYHYELFGWHRVTCYGDYRQEFVNLAKLYGLAIYEEDR